MPTRFRKTVQPPVLKSRQTRNILGPIKKRPHVDISDASFVASRCQTPSVERCRYRTEQLWVGDDEYFSAAWRLVLRLQ